MLARVAPLSPPARRLLDAAAIVPGTVELPLLDALAGDAARHLEECLSCGVLGPVGAAVAFRHDLARVAVEETLAPDQRLALHRRALAALAGADPARLAYHAEGAADADAVLRFAPAAAERAAAAGAHREAAAQYARALRFGAGLEPTARAALLRRRSHECFITDQPGEATGDLQDALESHRRLGDPRSEGDVLRELSSILWCPGQVDAAIAPGATRSPSSSRSVPGRELGMAYANMASLAMNHEDAGETATWGARALELARNLDAAAIEIHALNSIGTMEFLARGPGARATAERSLELALRAGSSTTRCAPTPTSRGLPPPSRLPARRPLPARGHRVRERSRARPVVAPPARLSRPLGARPGALGRRHRHRRARRPRPPRLAATHRARARRVRPPACPPRRPRPLGPLDEALTLAGPELQRIEPIALARAEAAWLSGDNDRAIAETDRIAALAQRCDARWVTGEVAVWRRRAGAEVDPGGDVAEPFALELAGAFAQAAECWTALGCPYEAALALAGSGDERALRRAHAALRGLGATAAAAVVARDLRRRGAANLPRGPRAATRRTPRSSRRASSRSSPWSPTACATATSPTACSSRPRRSSTTWRRSAASSARARAARRAPRRCGWACCPKEAFTRIG